MSKYNLNCSKSSDNGQRNRKGTLISKPFCDCNDCPYKSCPDILQMLAISVTANLCDFGSKGKKRASKCSLDATERPSLLDVLNDQDCGCEVVARAVRSNVHMNLGLTQRRAATAAEEHTDSQNSKDVAKKK